MPDVLLAHVKAYILRHSLLFRGQALAVGVSGGPDSIVLLHLLTRLREEFRLHLIVAHLDHGLRPESGAEAAWVARTAGAWGVTAVIERADVAALAQAHSLSIEEAGRVARYEFFGRVSPAVAVAHNADDQAETVLMHFLRGSGAGGLRGMLPKTRYAHLAGGQPLEQPLTVVRPLLATPRADIEAYISEHKLEAVTDPSNADRTYLRNRLRHDLLPHLEGYNPNIRRVLARTAEVLAGDYALLQSLVDDAWDEAALQHPATPAIAFSLARWRSLPTALQRALLRRAVTRLKPALRDADFTPIDQAARWSQSAASGHSADLLGGLCIQVVGDELRIQEWSRLLPGGEAEPHVGPLPLPVPGETLYYDFTFTSSLLESFSLADLAANADPNTAYVDAELAPFTVRARRAGERFQPLGFQGTTKVSDYMINRKIPADRRARWPLLCCGEAAATVLWVCGHALAEQARVTPATKTVAQVVAHPNHPADRSRTK